MKCSFMDSFWGPFQRKMTSFNDLPDLCLIEICHYLKSGEVLQSLFDVTHRLDDILVERKYLSNINLYNVNVKLFQWICDSKLLEKVSKLVETLAIDEAYAPIQLKRFNSLGIFSQFDNVKCLALLFINNISDVYLFFESSYSQYLPNLQNLKIRLRECLDGWVERNCAALKQFSSFVREHILFNTKKTSLERFDIKLNSYLGLLLKSPEILTKNDHIHRLRIHLGRVSDVLFIFDHFPSLDYLNISLIETVVNVDFDADIVDETYDFESLPLKLPQLKDFTLKCYWGIIDYKILEKIIKNLIYLNKLNFICNRSNLSSYINGDRIDQMLSNLTNLKELNFCIKFALEVPADRVRIEESFIDTRMKWKICFNLDELGNVYSIYTLPWFDSLMKGFNLLNASYDGQDNYWSVRDLEVYWACPHVTSFSDISQILLL
ncbi:unnamed protein product [Didymodactylos carnosus]|uniref:F-box domain-containing protein n=1 Tax=Didymodactylos carnosus TaxID=1234261 RepID=A0A815Q0M3_9BILA|nr:unnamed protein product [Didymodactylos carnosus]CAF4327787.1 unnamed protein product [Didymodactylos carnosus]